MKLRDTLPILLLSALALAPRPALALTSWFAEEATDMTYLDGGNPADNYSPAAASKLLVNAGEAEGETHVLFRAPPELFDADVARLAKATATFSVTRARNWDDRAIELLPLATAYDTASTTWLDRETGTPWTTEGGGGDVLEGSVFTGVYDEKKQTVTFDLLPLLANADAAAAFKANGALVRLNSDERPEASFVMLQLATPVNGDETLHPQTFWVELDPYADARDFAVSYIDSRDASTVYWEQGLSTVGKVVLNGRDGSECRAIVSMPEGLSAAAPSRIQSVIAKFDAEIQDWEGEDIFLAPLTTPTKLERHPNNDTTPVHGPSWNCADASVDTNATSYVIDDETFDNAPWEVAGGDWMTDHVVKGTVHPPSGTSFGSAEFDLTELWQDDETRTALIANGAIVFLDPERFGKVKDDKRIARVNLYRPDDVVVATRNKHSWMRVTEYESLAGIPATTYIDSSAPDKNFASANKTLVTLNNASSGTEARALVKLPPSLLDVDLHNAGSVNLLVSYFKRWTGDDGVNPIALHPAATAFRLGEATWNSATADTAWETAGGDYLDAHVTASDSAAQSMLIFDLAPLLADPDAASALTANGAVIRMLGEAPEASNNNGYNVNGSLSTSVPAIVLAPAELAVRALGADPETGALHFSVAGLDPTRTYVLESTSDLVNPHWTTNQVFSLTGELSVVPPENTPASYYRISTLED